MTILPSIRSGNSLLTLQMSDLLRDARNVDVLRLLRDDPRMSVSALARRVGMSAPAVRERIQRLEEAGIIKGYRLDIDARALGYPIAAFVRIRPMPGQLARIAELAQSMPQIVECDSITGEDCFILYIFLYRLDVLNPVLCLFLSFILASNSQVHSP